MHQLFNTLYANKTVIITRGLSGSGKSTIAQTIAGSASYNNCSVAIHETDQYFMVDGEYKFDPSLIRVNHSKNFEAFCNSIDDGVHIVINSNTNTRHWEYMNYVEYASKNGYNVQIIDLYDNGFTTEELHKRQLHDFPIEKYELVRDGYERTFTSEIPF
tara:strand:+ start:807 stop:1283 length:477 start_codon:yes stop_codon:yes gene_type:complete